MFSDPDYFSSAWNAAPTLPAPLDKSEYHDDGTDVIHDPVLASLLLMNPKIKQKYITYNMNYMNIHTIFYPETDPNNHVGYS